MKLTQLKLGTRLALGFGLVLVLLAFIVALSWQRLTQTQTELATISEMRERAALTGSWKEMTNLNSNRTLAVIKSGGNAEVLAFFTPRLKETSEQISQAQKALEPHLNTQEGKALFADIADKRKAYIGARDEVFARLKAGDAKGAAALVESSLLPASDSYIATIGNFQKFSQQEVEARTAAMDNQVARARLVLLALGALCLVVGVWAAWSITRSVTKPLRKAAAVTQAIAGGDLSGQIQVKGRDEVGDLLRGLANMQTALRGIVSQVRGASDSIATGSEQIAAGNTDLSHRTEQQASDLQQTAASMTELSATVSHNADTARQATQLAGVASEVAAEGGVVVSRVVKTMDDINDASKRIADIIGVIDGIAFQTNVLALNAAVEAARAGEQGRGFAVVASEVRSLAGRSAEAAKEIKGLIANSVDKVTAGSKLVAEAGNTMGEIVERVRKVSDLISEISSATTEQTTGINQVSEAVANLDQSTQQNAALVEESAAAASSLSEQAVQLVHLVSVFKLTPGQLVMAAPEFAPSHHVTPPAAARTMAKPLALVAPKRKT